MYKRQVLDTLILMCKTAGLATRREPMGVLDDDTEERPADFLIENWTVDGVEFSTHAVDLTCPLSDSSWNGLSAAARTYRAKTVGVAGLAAEKKKRINVGTSAEQRHRENSDPMSVRCRKREVNFWPVGLEGDGVPTKAFSHFFNAVCDSAKNLRGLNRGSFKSYFQSRIANVLHQTTAALALRRIAVERIRLSGQERDAVYGPVDPDEVCQEQQTILPSVVSYRRDFVASNRGLLYTTDAADEPLR